MEPNPNGIDREFGVSQMGPVRLVLFCFGIVGFAFVLLMGVLSGEFSPWRVIAFVSACVVGDLPGFFGPVAIGEQRRLGPPLNSRSGS